MDQQKESKIGVARRTTGKLRLVLRTRGRVRLVCRARRVRVGWRVRKKVILVW